MIPCRVLCWLAAWLLSASAIPLYAQTLTTNGLGKQNHSTTQPAPRYNLLPYQLGVVVNLNNPASVALGKRYIKQRGIPERNLIQVHINASETPENLDLDSFNTLKQEIERQTNPHIQALLLVWSLPYAVGCNSITSALTLGYHPEVCASTTTQCTTASNSAYFDSSSREPYTDLKIRPSMLLPTEPAGLGEKLIARGKQADGQHEQVQAFFLKTSDPARNTRAAFFPPSGKVPALDLSIKTVQADSLRNEKNILLYHTGQTWVGGLETLSFAPGALADHLTSMGGILRNNKEQMTVMAWLNAGATASYGTVSEPCNHWQKFPNSSVLLKHYLNGASAIEAYWKSVAWPYQGLFIGEPLAAPYRH